MSLLVFLRKLLAVRFRMRRSPRSHDSWTLRSTQSLDTGKEPAAEPEAGGKRELQVDQVLAGRFRVTAFIARGGMGEVYAAEDLRGGGSVALKTIRAEGASSAEMMERF